MEAERRFTDEQLARAKQTDLVALMQSRGVELHSRGASWQGCCPFHEDSTPSLTVTPSKGLWNCFGCGAAGDAVRFVELRDGCTFVEAVKTLLGFEGEDRPAPSLTAPALDVVEVSPAERTKLLTRVAAHYHRAFLDHPEGLRYLVDVRGLRDTALFKTFHVGLANGSLLEALPQDGPILAQLRAIGVLTATGREFFGGCVVFPLWNTEGAIVNLYGRRLKDGEVNHLYLPGPRQGLWNAQAARRSESVLLSESVIDALSVVDAGLSEVMPCYGVHGMTDEHLHWLVQNGVKRAVLAFDGDDAGRRGMETVQRKLSEAGLAVGRLALPEGADLNSALCGTHADEARAAMAGQVGAAFASLLSSAPATDAPAAALPGEQFELTPSGFKLGLHGRRYEVKGIARVTTQLKATVKATGDARKGFELTTLDLYSARSRDAYAKACALLFGAEDDVIRADLARLIERVEAWQAPGAAAEVVPVSSPADEARARVFLANPALLDEVLADLVTLGVAGEQTNKLLCYLAVISRKLDDPLSLLIQSRSAAGKSTLQHAVLALTPDEDQVHYTRLTCRTKCWPWRKRKAWGTRPTACEPCNRRRNSRWQRPPKTPPPAR
jgi:DNA primase catalytic core